MSAFADTGSFNVSTQVDTFFWLRIHSPNNMKYSEQPLQTFRLRNFKAVRDSGVVKFTPLTVFIGN